MVNQMLGYIAYLFVFPDCLSFMYFKVAKNKERIDL